MENIKELAKKTQHLNVLFVEDEEDIRNSVKTFFKKFVKTLHVAENGEEGLLLYKENEIDVVITDIIMPTMDGFQMLEEIRKINPNIFVIILSATDDDKIDTNTSYDLKIKKPILFENLTQIIKVISEI